MKKYIIPFTLVFTTSLFVWNTQRVDTNEEIVQTENSDRSVVELEDANPPQINDSADSETVSVTEQAEELNNIANSQVAQTPPSQAPPSRPRIIVVLEEASVAELESTIKTQTSPQKPDTRISLLETSMKYPMVILEEKGQSFGQKNEQVFSANAHVASHLMLNIKPGTNLVLLQEKLSSMGCEIGEQLGERNFIIKLKEEPSIESHYAIKEGLESLDGFVESVEPDYLVYAIKTPNDPKVKDLWGLHNSGQTGGTADKDIDALEAWDFQTGSKDILVGVVDTGVDRTHQDLAANMWTNPGEIPGNGKDDDGNGFVDDVHGWDFYDDDNNPKDGGSHGTHCAGTIGAVGNNGKGVVGVSWNVSMVGIRFLGPMGGYTSDAVKSIKYATKIGVHLTSNSWGGGGYSSSLKNAIDEAGEEGIGFVAAAGNSAYDNDSKPSYPASYESGNIISVGAHDHKGKIAKFSQWGKKSVDLFAPGVNVVSTIPGNKYASFNGTSMATPHVSGAYALLIASNPDWTVMEAKNALMNSVDLEDGLKSKCVSGGRLNIFQANSVEPPTEKFLVLKPAQLDFGTVSASKTIEKDFSLINEGNTAVNVSGFKSNSLSENSENLMGHWTFDGNTDDSSENQNHGNLISGEFVADREGNPSSALYMDGVDDHVIIPHSKSLSPVDQLSMSVWLKIDGFTNTWSPIIHKGGPLVSKGKNREYSFWVNSKSYLSIYSAGDNNKQVNHDMGIPTSEWFHYGLSLDRKNHVCKIFLNGDLLVLNKDNYSSFNNNNADLTIGTCNDIKYNWASNFKGTIDDLRLYNASLKAWQFNQLSNPQAFAEKASDINSKLENLMGQWSFDGNAVDSSVNQNHGNLVSGKFVADREGTASSALYLDGVDDHVVIPHSDSLNPIDQLSVSMWLKIDEFTNTWAPIIHKGGPKLTGWKNREYSFWANNASYISIFSAGDNKKNVNHDMGIPTSEWFHYGLSLDRKDHICKIFLNGNMLVLKNDNYSSFNNNNHNLTIGTCDDVKYNWASNFKGTIDDLRLYNVALDSYDYEQIINGPIENTESPFVVSIDLPAVIEPGTGLKGTVTFENDTEGVFEDTVTFTSDAKNSSTLELSMVAEVQALPRLEADPESMHFGLLDGETKYQPLTLSNVGNGELKYQIVLANDPNGEGTSKSTMSLWGIGTMLGDGTHDSHYKATKILDEPILEFTTDSGGAFIKKDGSVWYWGHHSGDGTDNSYFSPIKIFSNGVKGLGSHRNNFIFKNDGSLWATGSVQHGKLGFKSKSFFIKDFIQIFEEGVAQTAESSHGNFVIKEDGSLWAAGWSGHGQLSNKVPSPWVPKWYLVFSGGVKQVSSWWHTLVLKENGSVWSFGRNDHGQLGDSKPTWQPQSLPREVISEGAVEIATGSRHSLILKKDGSLWGMGLNEDGQLGIDTPKGYLAYPTKILSGGVKKIDAHGHSSYFQKTDGSLWGMGSNEYGELGQEKSLVNVKTPIKIVSQDGGVINFKAGSRKLLFTIGSAPPEQPLWLTIDSKDGDLGTGESGQIQVTANADLLPGDSATAYIIIESNDPITPKTVVTVTADKLKNGKGLVFIPGKVGFDDTYVGQTKKSPLSILNAGTEKVTVSKLIFMNSAFSHHLKLPFDLDAGEKINTTLYFEPNYEGQFDSSALVITSDNEPYKFPLSGNAVIAPALVYSPGQISESLSANDEKTVNFEIKNTGGSPLTWSIKGATPQMGSSYSLGQVFGMEHFAPLEKGASDQRTGSPISTMGGGPDFHGYSWTDSNDPAGPKHVWNDISKTGDLLTELSEKDDGYKEINLTSSTSFYGEDFQKVYVNTNGYITLGAPSSVHGHFPLPSTMMPNNLIAPMAMDLNPAKGGKIYVEQTEDKLTVQYDKVKDFAGIGEYTFQLVLQRNGVIFHHYHKIPEGDTKTTIGIQNGSGDAGLLVAYNNDQIKSGMSVRISTAPKWLHISKSSGTVEAGASENLDVVLKAGMIDFGKYEATLELTSNDPKNLNSSVPVTLSVEASKLLSANPSQLSFGEVEVGLSKTLEVKVTNEGNAPVSLSSLKAQDAAFSSSLTGTILKPGAIKTISVTFKPTEGVNYGSNSFLYSDADNGPHSISLLGSGLATPKLRVTPELVNITVEAGKTGSEKAVIDNLEGLADGTYEVVEIRSGKATSSSSVFDETSNSNGETIPDDAFSNEHIPNELIVAFKDGANSFDNPQIAENGVVFVRSLGNAIQPGSGVKALSGTSLSLIRNESAMTLRELADKLSKDPAVDYVEPNYIVRHTGTPNDPKLDKQWALPKIEAAKAWDSAIGSDSVIVAVIDTGIDYNHPDLQGNIWKNPGEIAGNKIDDDGNGYVDDVYGWDFCNKDNDPMDGDSHGTHVAGTIAAATNNGQLVAGVSWHASMVALKFLSDEGWGSIADAIDAVAYCAAMEFPISNNSWGGGGYSQAMKDAIAEAANNGHLFCAAAGNSASNNDKTPHYPSNYDLPSVLSVAASNSSDKLAWFSCFGHKTVDMAAPGEGILSLIPNGGTASYSGTSMATPHVAGAAALLLSINPDYGHQELKNTLLNTVDPIPAFEGKMVSPGRLNLANAVGEASPSWLTVTPEKGTISAGGKKDLLFTADASNFTAGTKSAVVVLETNDPVASIIEVPVELTITGKPVIELSTSSLDFGTVWTSEVAARDLEVKNVGTDVLNITALNFGNGVFSTELNAFVLQPGKAQTLVIQAKPNTSGDLKSTLEVSSNDEKNPVSQVELKVTGISPPSLSFDPKSISLTLEKGLSEDRNISISNSGEAEGLWNAYLVETGSTKSNKMNLANILESMANRASVPEIRSPRMLTMSAHEISNLNDSEQVVRFESNPGSSLEVAVLGAAFDYESEDIAKGLVSTKMFGGVTMINVKWLTPTIEELSAFDAILVYSIDPYHDAEALGNVVTDYVMKGGGVVTASHEGNTHSMGGKWVNQKLNLYAKEENYKKAKNELGEILVDGHPILANVKSFKGNSYHQRKSEALHSTVVANWADGTPLVTIGNGKEKIADLSFWPVSDKADHKGYFPGWNSSTDGWQLIANSLSWVISGNTPDWITGSPLSSKVKGNSKQEMILTISSKNLEEGEYFAEVQFTSNDPVNSFSVVDVHLIVKENQPPVAKDLTVKGIEDDVVNFELVASDQDGDTLSYEIVGKPTNGIITGTAPNLTYLPNPNFNGKDSLSFKASDGSLESNVAIVTIDIEAQNDAPIVESDEINGTEDQFIVIEFKHSDPDGDNLSVQITKQPDNGFLWEENGMTLYFPENHFNGQDEIRFTMNDGDLTSKEATIMINLKPENDAPVAEELVFQTQQKQTVVITLEAVDVDGDNVTFDLETLPEHGIISQVNTSTWNYTPNEQFTGTDTFFYRANDSMIQSDLAKVSINVNNENNAPVVQNSTFSMQEDGNLPVKLVASDPEGDALNFSIVNGPSNGTLSGNGPDYEYTPDANFNGTDQFTVVANDGMLESDSAIITMLVSSQNDAPTFVKSINTMSSGLRETPYRIEVEVEDVDNDELSLTVAKDPENGICYFENEKLVYLPNPGFEGIDNIELELSDGTEVVRGSFPVSIVSHSNPIYLNSDLEVHPELLDMLYQANEILFANADRTLELSTDQNGNSLTAEFTTQILENPIDLNDWLEEIKSEVVQGKFVFASSEKVGGLSWKVAPLLDPSFSADTDLHNENSSANTETEQVSDITDDMPETKELVSNERDSLPADNNDERPTQDTSSNEQTDEKVSTEDASSGDAQNDENLTSSFITEIGSGWYEAPGIGTFYDAGNGWIYEPNMGWSFLKVCSSDCSAWLFNENLGWLWFSTDLPNMTFSNNEGVANWIYYPGNTLGQSDLVFDYAQSSWMQWK